MVFPELPRPAACSAACLLLPAPLAPDSLSHRYLGGEHLGVVWALFADNAIDRRDSQ